MTVRIINADCLNALRDIPDASVHAVVCDPPYGLANTDSAHVVEILSRWFAGDRDYLPTGKGFMGKAWDAFVPPPAVWDECYRVLKPGGHLLCFAGTRTVDLMGLSIRLAGFDVRDTITWLYGSGFPKSLDVGKAIDKAAGATREVVGVRRMFKRPAFNGNYNADGRTTDTYNDDPSRQQVRDEDLTAPATPEAQQWHGWGTALKPASEPIVVARKPLDGTVAANVLAHGTGALNIDACRVGTTVETWPASRSYGSKGKKFDTAEVQEASTQTTGDAPAGRWPANVVLDGDAADALDEQSGVTRDGVAVQRNGGGQAIFGGIGDGANGMGARPDAGYGGGGGASRFFPVFRDHQEDSCPTDTATSAESTSSATAPRTHDSGTSTTPHGSTGSEPFPAFRYQAKAPARERPSYEKDGAGSGRVTGLGGKVRQCNVCDTRAIASGAGEPSCGHSDYRWADPTTDTASKVAHPTVKPLDLMRWLVRLVTPAGGTVLDPFAGSGTTIEAALLEGFDVIGIEREADYLPLIQQRIDRAQEAMTPAEAPPAADTNQPSLWDDEGAA